jgi:hypothetical protein
VARLASGRRDNGEGELLAYTSATAVSDLAVAGQPGMLGNAVGWGRSLVNANAIGRLRVEWRRILHAFVHIFTVISVVIHLRSWKASGNKKKSLLCFELAIIY